MARSKNKSRAARRRQRRRTEAGADRQDGADDNSSVDSGTSEVEEAGDGTASTAEAGAHERVDGTHDSTGAEADPVEMKAADAAGDASQDVPSSPAKVPAQGMGSPTAPPTPLTQMDRRKAKKALKRLRSGKSPGLSMHDVELCAQVYGASPAVTTAKLEILSAEMAKRRAQELTVQDLRDMLHATLFGESCPWWMTISNKPLVNRVILLHLPGLGASALSLCSPPPPFLSSLSTVPVHMFRQKIVIDPIEDLVFPRAPIVARIHGGSWTAKKLRQVAEAVTKQEMVTLKYPCCAAMGFEEAACSTPTFIGLWGPACGAVAPTSGAPSSFKLDDLLALDCEMCQTAAGLELTRLTVVNSAMEVLFDMFVKPDNAITDYLTRWSGITADTLASVTTRLADAQAKLLSLITPTTVLVGHSLHNDLVALQMYHPYVLDTSVLFPHTQGEGRRFSLRTLTQRFLGRGIQQSEGGHDSVEDARAAMELVLLKIANGMEYGNPFCARASKTDGTSLLTRLAKVPRRLALVGAHAFCTAYEIAEADVLPTGHVSDALRQLLKLASRRDETAHHFVLGQIECTPELLQEDPNLQHFDQQLQAIAKAATPNTCLLLLAQAQARSGEQEMSNEDIAAARAGLAMFGIC